VRAVSVLELKEVSKRYRSRQREQLVLAQISLQIDAGELVVIYGARRSGRTTLLRIAAGLERPDSGSVTFQGRDLEHERDRILGEGIAYVHRALNASEEEGVLEQIAAPLLARGIPIEQARSAARAALARAGGEERTAALIAELNAGETTQVKLARALVLSPALVVFDEPVAAVALSERDHILARLRTLAGEGTAVLASASEPGELAGATRALTLADGQLRGATTPQLAPVVALRRSS